MTGHPWHVLPAEQRRTVLDCLADWAQLDGNEHAIAYLTTVSREWQDFFESITFRHLKLNQFDLPALKKMMTIAVNGKNIANRGLTRHSHLRQLDFHIVLPTYDCEDCARPESEESVRQHETIFTLSISSLLAVLSLIQEQRGKSGPGLVLGLAISSPSDSQHAFKDFRLDPSYDGALKRLPSELNLEAAASRYYSDLERGDDDHDWYDGRLNRLTTAGERRRVMGGRPLRFHAQSDIEGDKAQLHTQPLPRVAIVTDLVLRRRFHRTVSASALSTLLEKSLVGLQSLRIERWRDIDEDVRRHEENGFERMFLTSLPEGLTSLHLFDDKAYKTHRDVRCVPMGQSAALTLSRTTRSLPRLQNLSAPFLIDASDFFHDFKRSKAHLECDLQLPDWECLETLSLTSLTLTHCERPQVRKLWCSAGRAVARMPRLRVLELWHCYGEEGCILTFSRAGRGDDGRPSVVRQVTPGLGDRVPSVEVLVGAWNKLHGGPFTGYGGPIQWEDRPLSVPDERTRFKYPGDLLGDMRLGEMILDPLSYSEMRLDASRAGVERLS